MSSMYGFTATGSGAMAGNKIPKGYSQGRLQQFTPEQMQLFQSLFSHLNPGGRLSQLAGGDEETFKQIEGPALRQFSGLQGDIASRFSGMGQGARRSSGFQNTMNQAASDFASQLQSQRQGIQRQALGDLFGLSESLLGQRPYEQFLTQKQHRPSFLESLLGGLSGGLGMGIGMLPGLF